MANVLVVAELSTAEQFVLGVCRCWDAFMDDPDPALAWRELTPVFHYMNVPLALCAFERAFLVLHANGGRRLQFRDVDSLSVAEDEVRLLAGIAFLQRSEPHAAVELLSGALPRVRVRELLAPLARIAAILDARGHRLRSWRIESPAPLRWQYAQTAGDPQDTGRVVTRMPWTRRRDGTSSPPPRRAR